MTYNVFSGTLNLTQPLLSGLDAATQRVIFLLTQKKCPTPPPAEEREDEEQEEDEEEDEVVEDDDDDDEDDADEQKRPPTPADSGLLTRQLCILNLIHTFIVHSHVHCSFTCSGVTTCVCCN